MPGLDGTGPMGMGPRTGGQRGFCSPGSSPYYRYRDGGWYARKGAGRGGIPWGCGRGRAYGGGRGRGWYYPAMNRVPAAYSYAPVGDAGAEQEVEFLKNQAETMEQELQQIRGRIDELLKSKKQAPQ